MTLSSIRENDVVLVDANIIVYYIRGVSDQCGQLIRRCTEREVYGVITTHTVAEVMHQLMLAEARENGWITGSNPARQLSGQPERVRRLSRYELAIKSLLSTGLNLELILKEDILTSMKMQRQTGLLTNDALLLAVADRLRIHSIASADKAFKKVHGIALYTPDDLRL
jgi:predicted nucleic acid-binding protein